MVSKRRFAVFAVLLGIGLPAVSAQAAQALTLGKTTIGASAGGGLVANAKRVNEYQLTVPASVSKLDVYLAPSGTAGTQVMEGVIYADAGGSPGALVAQSQQISFSSTSRAGWYDLPLASDVTLSPGEYWLGIYTGATSAVAGYFYDAGSSSRARLANDQTYASGRASNPFGAVGWSDKYEMSLYATYTTPTWTLQSLPAPAGSSAGQLSGVSCPLTADCMAVGNYQRSSGDDVTFAARWNGTSWSILNTPKPAGAGSDSLDAVSCTSSMACTAVGTYQTSSGTGATLAERWNGASWSIQTTPKPAGAVAGVLNGVSCPSATECVAVGYTTNSGGTQQSLAERWSGTSWSIQAVSAPAGTTTSVLNGVTCPSTTACTAVGDYVSSEELALVEQWNGSRWSIQPSAPAPSGAYGTWFNGVSCTSTSACSAVGVADYIDPTPLAERLSGKTWAITPTPISVGDGELFGVSCASTTACVAVGISIPGPFGPIVRVVLQWNGIGWSAVTTPGSADGQMLGVSCSSPIACTAVGSIGDAAEVPAAERYG